MTTDPRITTGTLTITSHSSGQTVDEGQDITGTLTYDTPAGGIINALLENATTGAVSQSNGFINDDGSGTSGSFVVAMPSIPSGWGSGVSLNLTVGLFDSGANRLAYQRISVVARPLITTGTLTIAYPAAGATVYGGEDTGGDVTYDTPAGGFINIVLRNSTSGTDSVSQSNGFINDDGSGTAGTWIAALPPMPPGTSAGEEMRLTAGLYSATPARLAYVDVLVIAGEDADEEEEELPYEGAEPGAELPELALPWTTDMSFVMLYEQQNPIYQVVLPITPSELPESGDADVKQYRIIGAGQHSFPDGRSERKYSLAGYFPGGPRFDAGLPHIHFDDWRPPQDLASQIRDWMDRRTRLRYRSMGRAGRYDVPVYLSHYAFRRTGHAGDIAFELDLVEWRTIHVRVDDGTDATEALIEQDQATDADEPEEPAPVDYTVKPGDTLWFLAKEFLGDAARWPELYEANVDVIGDDPHWIYPGQVFRIPGGTVGTEENDGFSPAGLDAVEETG